MDEQADGKICISDFSISPRDVSGKVILLSTEDNDISVLNHAQAELGKRQILLGAILDKTPGGILLIDEESHRMVEFNNYACSMHGYSREEFAALTISDLEVSVSRELLDERRRRIEAEGRITFEDVHKCRDGSVLDVQISLSRLQVDGRWHTLALWTDISDLKQAQRALCAKEEEVRSIIEHSPDGMVRYDRKLKHIYVNAAMRNFVRPTADKTVGRRIRKPVRNAMPREYEQALKEAFRTGRNTQIEMKYAGPAGEHCWALVNFSPEADAQGEVATVLAIIRDITELVVQRKRTQQLAYTDALTGLASRAGFNVRFADVLEFCHRTRRQAALLVFDLDRFKDVNDSLGHPAGDELLRQIGERLQTNTRRADVLARLGGDEFAILLSDFKVPEDIAPFVERVQKCFLAPFRLDGVEVFSSTAIGIAIYPTDGETPDDLFAHADAAMYSAKSSGRGGVRFYARNLTEEAARRLTLSTDLQSACANGQFELVYQPKVSLSDGTCIGAEALLRWHHPERGLLTPDAFISIAEETGVIVEIGRWVLQQACRAVAEWNRAATVPMRLAVNLSSRQFVNNDIVADVRGALNAARCLGEWLECEITESLILGDSDSVHVALAELGKMGVSIALDDFGTGQSALSYLNRFQIDVLKIDRSFVGNMECDWQKAELVKAFISVADALGMATVAEGIESSDQARILLRLGCATGQGYHFSRPLSEDQFRCRYRNISDASLRIAN